MPIKGEQQGYTYKALINGEWQEVTIQESPLELVERFEQDEEWTRVRHGRWKKKRNPMRYQVVPYVFVCDQCGTAFEYDTPYCGECGAKMDEVEDG